MTQTEPTYRQAYAGRQSSGANSQAKDAVEETRQKVMEVTWQCYPVPFARCFCTPRHREMDIQNMGQRRALLPGSLGYITCSLNGPGDVMNCHCPAGFVYTATGTVNDGHFTKTKSPQNGFDFAQFEIADPVHRTVIEAVECTRQAHR
jgi:hypothetical protein